MTDMPQPGSPLIDAGSNALIQGDDHGADIDGNGTPGETPGDDLTADQRGEARIQNATVDIGAVESSPNAAPSISVNDVALIVTEDGSAVEIDPAATLSDADGDADWDGGTLVIQVTGNAQAGDSIAMPDNVVGTIRTTGFSLRDGPRRRSVPSRPLRARSPAIPR